MERIQKRAHVEVGDVLKVNAGLFVLRRFLSGCVPCDFEWAFLFAEDGDVVVSWTWRKEELVYQGEARHRTVLGVIEEVQGIDWASERINARVAGSGRALV